MSCRGCPDDDRSVKKYDKTGNEMNHPAEQKEREIHEQHRHEHPSMQDMARAMTYKEYKKRKSDFRADARELRNKTVVQFTEDYKRIQIEELLAVHNLEEVHFKLTPEQAVVALWEFTRDKEYTNVIDEFEGLREAIDRRHSEIMKNKIELKWRP